MSKSDPPDRLGGQVCVRDLKGHPDGEREVGEVEVGGSILLVEVDASCRPGKVGARVAEAIDRVHSGLGQHDARYTDPDEIRHRDAVGLARTNEQESDGRQECDPGN
jgi:hypothetical protein